MKKSVMLIGSSEVSICNFRKELVERLIDEDFQVIISSPYGGKFDELIAKGCIFVDTPMDRRGKNALKDVELLVRYLRMMHKYRPGLVITYTIKPNLYGCIAARILRIPCIMNITGLGTELENEGMTKKFLISALKPLMRKSECVFFQNIAHLNMFKEMGIVSDNCRLVAGSGVNLKEHYVREYRNKDAAINFLYVGRLMRDKGINELVKATKIAKESNSNINVTALGFCEEGYENDFNAVNKDGIIKHLKYTSDVDCVIAEYDAIINPSYHEGMSNALLEGASCGRPLLASDVAGCFETVDDGESGYLFKVKNAQDMAEKMLMFADLPESKRIEMGIKGRRKMENEFDREKVVDAYMNEVYKILRTENVGSELVSVGMEEKEDAQSFSAAGNL